MWEAVTTREFQDYFVDGSLLATRWKNEGEYELREWWEIKSLKDGKMQWKALRANEDGSTFQQIMDWEKYKKTNPNRKCYCDSVRVKEADCVIKGIKEGLRRAPLIN